MKKITLLSLLAFMFTLPILAQKTYSRPDIFTAKEITWFGLDFSKIKLIDPLGFTNPEDIKNNQFRALNYLVVNEPDKYDLKKFFNKEKVDIDLAVVKERNKLPDVDKLVLDAGAEYSLDEATVREMISAYKPEETEGIGLVFIMEKFDKGQETGFMWVTFFDIASKKVLLTEKMSGKAGGFGWRNYWAKT